VSLIRSARQGGRAQSGPPPTQQPTEQTPEPAAQEATKPAAARRRIIAGAGRQIRKQCDPERFGQTAAGDRRAENIVEQTHKRGSLLVKRPPLPRSLPRRSRSCDCRVQRTPLSRKTGASPQRLLSARCVAAENECSTRAATN